MTIWDFLISNIQLFFLIYQTGRYLRNSLRAKNLSNIFIFSGLPFKINIQVFNFKKTIKKILWSQYFHKPGVLASWGSFLGGLLCCDFHLCSPPVCPGLGPPETGIFGWTVAMSRSRYRIPLLIRADIPVPISYMAVIHNWAHLR